jgi:hypothetical protein
MINRILAFALTGLIFAFESYALTPTPSITYTLSNRDTNLNWNIAGDANGANPNVASELSWTDIKSNHLGIGLNWNDGDYFLNTLGEYGLIYSGNAQDSDYNLNNRHGEYSRAITDAGKGFMFDAQINYGKNFIISSDFKISISAGYSSHTQHLSLYDGIEVISNTPLDNLDSVYEAKWSGPQVGMNTSYRLNNNIVSIGYTHQQVTLKSYTDWNLRSDLEHPKSMTQSANGAGRVLSIGVEHALSNKSSLTLKVISRDYMADGMHTFHNVFVDNDVQKLNAANWKSQELQLFYRSLF